MQPLLPGDPVRIDIPDNKDPEFSEYHRKDGIIISVFEDSAEDLTGDPRDNAIYTVEFDNGDQMDFRWRNIRTIPDR